MTVHHLPECPTPSAPGVPFVKPMSRTSEAVVTRCDACHGYDPASLRQRPRVVSRVVFDPDTGRTFTHTGPATDTDTRAWAIAERRALTDPTAPADMRRAGRSRVDNRASAAAAAASRAVIAAGGTSRKARAAGDVAAADVRAQASR